MSDVSANIERLLLEMMEDSQPVIFSAHIAEPVENISLFLQYVMDGEQNKAYETLNKMPSLAQISGDICEFRHITGFQLALWLLDQHMWTMIRQFLSDEEALAQVKFCMRRSWVAEHGICINWNTLLILQQQYTEMWRTWTLKERMEFLVKNIGLEQSRLPRHVIQYYTSKDNLFKSKDFLSQLPRRNIPFNICELGRTLAIWRGNKTHPTYGCSLIMKNDKFSGCDCEVEVYTDREALIELYATRTRQRMAFIEELTVTSAARPKPAM